MIVNYSVLICARKKCLETRTKLRGIWLMIFYKLELGVRDTYVFFFSEAIYLV